jgi:hypothetical protein
LRKDRRLTCRSQGSPHQRRGQEAAFVNQYEVRSQPDGAFLICGHR